MSDSKQTRNMPTDAKYLANKDLNDILYGYLQSISTITKDENNEIIRFVYFKHVNKSKIAETLNMSRPSANKYFKKLTEYGFLREIKVVDNYGRLVKALQLPEDSKQFVPLKLETLNFLLTTTNANVIKVYTYLKMRHGFKKKFVQSINDYEFTYKELSSVIGYIYHNTTNKHIQHILKALTLFGLIECRWNQTIGEKSMFRLIKVNDYIVEKSSSVNSKAHTFNERLPKTNYEKEVM